MQNCRLLAGKWLYLLSAFVLVSTTAHAQKLNIELFKNMKARNIGPGAMSGRITAIDAVQSNPDIIYAGAASGGVWKTENGGTTWTPIFDENPTINIGAIAIQQSNPSIIWVGTGEGNPRNSLNLGAGIYKSLDGGKSWQLMGLEKTHNIHRILIDPSHPNTVYVGVIGNPYAVHPERGVFKTTDGGKSWQKILYTNDTSGVSDMVMDPTNPNKLIVGMWHHKRTPWDFKSGGPGSGLYITWDGGQNWKKLSKAAGLPEGEWGRIGLAISRSEPKRIYALIESSKNALYRSDDGGFKWEMVNDDPEWVSNRPFYFQDIAVDPKNENRVYLIYQRIAMSEDGGKSYKTILPYSGIHPDHHAWWIHPQDPSFIIDGNDGGLAISRDRARKWTYVEALPIGQFYHVNIDHETPYNVYGGLQDNGSWTGPAYVWREGGLINAYWQSVLRGDGFDVSPDPDNNRFGYAMSQGGNLARYDKQTGQVTFIRPPAPNLQTRLRFNWNAGFAQDPTDHNTIYYGSQFLHKSTDKGNTWSIISPDLTTNNPLQQQQDSSGGLTIDITAAENHNTILCIAPSPKDKNVIWVGTDDGNVQVTTDGGKSWTNVNKNMPGLPKESWIPQIRASEYNPATAFVVVNNYRQGDFAPYIYRTNDFGKTWVRIVGEKDVKGYALCFLQDPVVPRLLFAGTENGLWISIDEGKNWAQWKNDYPAVSTMDLALQEKEADLVIASFGRGIWILDDIRPLRKIAAEGAGLLDKKLVAFDVPDAVALMGVLAQPGYTELGDAEFSAPNRPLEARIAVYVNPSKKTDHPSSETERKKPEEKSKKGTAGPPVIQASAAAKTNQTKHDSLVVKIFDQQNRLIRTLRSRLSDTAGIQYVNWGLEEMGVRFPGTPRPKDKNAEAAGLTVLPGTYKLFFQLGDQQDSSAINVKADTRINKPLRVMQAQRALLQKLAPITAQLTAATDRLAEAKEATDRLLIDIKEAEGKAYDSLRQATKSMQDSIKALNELILGKKLEKQGYGRPYQLTVVTKLLEAQRSIRSKLVAPGAAEEKLVEEVQLLGREAMDQVNRFFANQWVQYRQLVETTPVMLIKNYTPIR